jgi:hypothetical protein
MAKAKKEEVKEEVQVVEKPKFKLPNEKVIVKFIPRKKGMAANVPEDHIIAGGMIGEAIRKYKAPLQANGAIANVLTNEEKEYLENETGLKLSVYGQFWEDYSVTLMKDETNNKLDLSNPMDYLSYKLLLALKNDIAPEWSKRHDKLTYDFVITKGGEESKDRKRQYDSKKEAFKQYGKIEDNKDMLVGVLKLLTNKPISKDSTLDWVQEQVEARIDTMPTAFLDVISDPSFNTKVLINKGIEYGVIVKNGNKYATVDGLELAEADELPTFDNAVRYLDNPKHQDVRSLVEAKINNAE